MGLWSFVRWQVVHNFFFFLPSGKISKSLNCNHQAWRKARQPAGYGDIIFFKMAHNLQIPPSLTCSHSWTQVPSYNIVSTTGTEVLSVDKLKFVRPSMQLNARSISRLRDIGVTWARQTLPFTRIWPNKLGSKFRTRPTIDVFLRIFSGRMRDLTGRSRWRFLCKAAELQEVLQTGKRGVRGVIIIST